MPLTPVDKVPVHNPKPLDSKANPDSINDKDMPHTKDGLDKDVLAILSETGNVLI